jgi:exodeoxyribonuclease VII small subunit
MTQGKVTLEAALDRLEQITRALENGELELQESLELYEEGISLVRAAEAVIRDAELRIEALRDDGSTEFLEPGREPA